MGKSIRFELVSFMESENMYIKKKKKKRQSNPKQRLVQRGCMTETSAQDVTSRGTRPWLEPSRELPWEVVG